MRKSNWIMSPILEVKTKDVSKHHHKLKELPSRSQMLKKLSTFSELQLHGKLNTRLVKVTFTYTPRKINMEPQKYTPKGRGKSCDPNHHFQILC